MKKEIKSFRNISRLVLSLSPAGFTVYALNPKRTLRFDSVKTGSEIDATNYQQKKFIIYNVTIVDYTINFITPGATKTSIFLF